MIDELRQLSLPEFCEKVLRVKLTSYQAEFIHNLITNKKYAYPEVLPPRNTLICIFFIKDHVFY